MGLREKILNSSDSKKQLVEIPEWDVTVEVRSISGKDRAKIIQNNFNTFTKTMDVNGMIPDLIILSTYDVETGERIFDESDREEILKKSSGALDRIFNVAIKLSGLESESVSKAEKN